MCKDKCRPQDSPLRCLLPATTHGVVWKSIPIQPNQPPRFPSCRSASASLAEPLACSDSGCDGFHPKISMVLHQKIQTSFYGGSCAISEACTPVGSQQVSDIRRIRVCRSAASKHMKTKQKVNTGQMSTFKSAQHLRRKKVYSIYYILNYIEV